MKLINRKTKKLFYKKYLYKATFKTHLSILFRQAHQRKNFDSLNARINEYRTKIAQSANKRLVIGYYSNILIKEENIKDAERIRDWIKTLDNYSVRHEMPDNLSVYSNDLKDLQSLIDSFELVERGYLWEPNKSLVQNQEPDILISKKADEFTHKITIDMGALRRESPDTLKWVAANRDKVRISNYSLEKAYSYVGIYVRDEKVLMLFQLAGNTFIKKTERLVSPS